MQHLSHETLIKTATYASVTVASLLIGMKFYAWAETDALSLKATLIDSVLDALASLINMIAVREALKPADDEHRFGHGKIEALAALGQSLFIAGSAGFLLFDVGHRIMHPEAVPHTTLGMITMVVSMLLTALLLTYQNFVVKKTRSTAIHADATHYRSDFLINGGVLASLWFGHHFGVHWLDPLTATLIGLYIVYTAWDIASHSFHMLIDREFSQDERRQIEMILNTQSDVLGWHDLRTRSAGQTSFIQVHLELDAHLTLHQAHAISERVMRLIEATFPHAEVLIHEDPVFEVGDTA